MAPVRLALANVGDVHLNHGKANGTDAVGQGDGGMCVGSRIHHYPVVKAVGLLKFIDQVTFVVRLVVIQLHLREILTHGCKVFLKGDASVNLWLSTSQQVEVGTVDN